MVRRLTSVFVFVLAAGLMPSNVGAQTSTLEITGDGVTPLRTWCATGLGTHCVSIYSFVTRHFIGSGAEVSWDADVEVFGSGPYTSYMVYFVPPLVTSLGPEPDFGLEYGEEFTGRRMIAESSSTGVPIRHATLDDPFRFGWVSISGTGPDRDYVPDSFRDCVTSDFEGRRSPLCVRVPEPSGLLLLVGGIAGMGVMARRRRGDQSVG